MIRIPKKLFLLLTILLSLWLTGCYTIPAASSQISAVIQDNAYQPVHWRVPAGATITLNLQNKDGVPHDWIILYRQAVSPFDKQDVDSTFWKTSIEAGKSLTVQFKAPAAAGNYPVVDAKFLEEGMAGTITVVQQGSLQAP